MQWLQSADLDPNDPDNASLMELRRLLDSTQVHLDQEPRFRLRGRDASYMAPPRRGARDRQLRCKTRWADSGPCSPSRRRPAGGAGGGGGGREAARPQGRGDGGQQLASALRIWQRRLGDQLDLQRGLQAELASAPPPPCAPEPPHLVLTPNLSPPPQAATARGSRPTGSARRCRLWPSWPELLTGEPLAGAEWTGRTYGCFLYAWDRGLLQADGRKPSDSCLTCSVCTASPRSSAWGRQDAGRCRTLWRSCRTM